MNRAIQSLNFAQASDQSYFAYNNKTSKIIQYLMNSKGCNLGQAYSRQMPIGGGKHHNNGASQQNGEEVTRLFIPEKNGCRKGKEPSRDYECTAEGVKTIRMTYKREASFKKVELSSRESTYRPPKETLSQLETHRIKLFLSKLQQIVLRQRIGPFWKKIKTEINEKEKKQTSKNQLQRRVMEIISNRSDKSLAILSFPLISCKIDEIKAAFLGKLQLLHHPHAIRPYEAAIIFLLVRFQSRQIFLHLSRAFALLKLHDA